MQRIRKRYERIGIYVHRATNFLYHRIYGKYWISFNKSGPLYSQAISEYEPVLETTVVKELETLVDDKPLLLKNNYTENSTFGTLFIHSNILVFEHTDTLEELEDVYSHTMQSIDDYFCLNVNDKQIIMEKLREIFLTNI